jgi:hypothetical protein
MLDFLTIGLAVENSMKHGIAGLNISLSFTAIVPFNMTQVKTSTPTFALETTNHHQLSNVTMNQTRADGSADSCYAFRWHF